MYEMSEVVKTASLLVQVQSTALPIVRGL